MKITEENTTLLKSALKEGDKTAFKFFYEAYHDGLFYYLMGLTNNRAIAQDILQETFIKLWNNHSSLNTDQSIRSFLYTMAHNQFIDYYRKHKRELKLIDRLTLKFGMEKQDQDEELVQQQLKRLKYSIEKLPPRCKEIFELGKLQGYKYQEIAEILKISVKTVEVQMSKAFSILRKDFKK
ncbi:RNA polymerase sigma factor [Flagellimonas onchidii]|uniref:RNA polymerase sigma factor n=1 Tax=Flagellimonas onchidii TaxID=2562684 RepID=UPI0010A69753|nr:RNA polymerase sigma-70 factor [Allomuricauda onchidii]